MIRGPLVDSCGMSRSDDIYLLSDSTIANKQLWLYVNPELLVSPSSFSGGFDQIV